MERIAPGIWKIRLGKPEAVTPVGLREEKICTKELRALPKITQPPFTKADVKFKITRRGCTVTLPMGNDEHIFGFGLQLKSHDQRGLKKHLRVNSDPVADTGDSHAPVPFYVSTAGYGVLADTARYASFYGGSHLPLDPSQPEPAGVRRTQRPQPTGMDLAANTDDLYAARKLADAASAQRLMVIDVPAAKGLDVYLFAGPSMRNAVQRYVLFSGGGCLPPAWGLGVWYRPFTGADADHVLRLARQIREDDIPCDVIGLEPGWQSHTYSCTYVWDSGRFPDPDAHVAELRRMGYNVNLWQHAFVHPDSPIYEKMKPSAGSIEVWGGLVPDFTDKTARKAFADYQKKNLVDRGVTGFKLDECDNSDFISFPWSFPECSEFPSGLDGEQMHCLLGILYQRTLYGIFRKANVRTCSQARSSHALAAPYPFVLYSDLYSHRDFIRGVVTAGFSGLLWSPEVRQCASVEDLIRRCQSVCLSPHALVNAWMIKNTPWWQYDHGKNNAGEPLPEREDVTRVIREIFRLRMSLIPYLYAAFARYRFEGIPPCRSLAMDYPADEHAWKADNQWLVGEGLLAAPVIAGETRRTVYLPPGAWHCFWTRTRYDGGQSIEIDVPLQRIPLFVKDNTLLPLASPVNFVAPGTCFDITMHVFGDRPESFTLFEDDMSSFDYEKGKCNRVTLSWSRDAGPQVERIGDFAGERYKIKEWRVT
ncbi:MAG TPA: TIM-barrel domain-containing protein [Planctomycetota bacterium]|nr:TIM-barrel domain-containing protein [Planctomycetota bacterium]